VRKKKCGRRLLGKKKGEKRVAKAGPFRGDKTGHGLTLSEEGECDFLLKEKGKRGTFKVARKKGEGAWACFSGGKGLRAFKLPGGEEKKSCYTYPALGRRKKEGDLLARLTALKGKKGWADFLCLKRRENVRLLF